MKKSKAHIRFAWTAAVLAASAASSGCGIVPTAPVAAFGDSVTWGYGGLPGGWVDSLQLRSGHKISNLAIPGEKVGGGLDRLGNALSTVPGAKVLIVLHGGNDWVGIFRTGDCRKECDPSTVAAAYAEVGEKLKAIHARAKERDKRVVFATYWPSSREACSEYDAKTFDLYQAHLARLNAEAVRAASETGEAVIRLDDLTDLPKDADNWFDCLHPSRKGYEKIAERWMRDSDKWEP